MKTTFFCVIALLLPQAVCAATVTGKLMHGGGIDDMQITVKVPGGKTISAYCDQHCGDWFITGEHDIARLKRKLMGKKIVLTYAEEKNRDRIAGPGEEGTLTFVKKVELLP